jgi:hypothetical protein
MFEKGEFRKLLDSLPPPPDPAMKGVVGSVCPRCKGRILKGQFVDKVGKVWQHSACPRLELASVNTNRARTESRARLFIVRV